MKAILEQRTDISIVGEFSRGADLCTRESYYKNEILVFAAPLHDLTEALLRELKVRFGSIRIVLIARADEMERFIHDVGVDACALLTSDSHATCLPEAIRAVDGGNAYISIDMLRLLTREAKPVAGPHGHACLTQRELEICTRLAAGENNALIGFELDISAKTVSTYKTRLMEKLGLTTVPDLVQYALKNGLIELTEACNPLHARHANVTRNRRD